jgi:transposase
LLAPGNDGAAVGGHSGLDPVHQVSGTSLHKPSHISRAGNRHLRRALYMPALSAVRLRSTSAAFYQTAAKRHKTGLQALMAVERKTAARHLWNLQKRPARMTENGCFRISSWR